MEGMTIALIRGDAISGRSRLRRGMSLYSLIEAVAALLAICISGRRFDENKVPIHLCSVLFVMVCGPIVVGAMSLVGVSLLHEKWKSSVLDMSKFIPPTLAWVWISFPDRERSLEFSSYDWEMATRVKSST